ncbi:MAG: AbrB/MazE/SpoVT family DNA-binding domain-containing protein [Rhodothermales bacterium]
MTVRARIVSIGNSQGVRIPKLLLEQTGIQGEVELEVLEDRIIIHALRNARKDWEQAFQEMASNSDDILLDEDSVASTWDEQEWIW